MTINEINNEKSQYKIVYFNRRETEFENNKIEYDNEVFTLKNRFESTPTEYLFTVFFYAPMGNANELYEKNIRARTKQEAENKFMALKFVQESNTRLRIKSIKLQQEVVKTW